MIYMICLWFSVYDFWSFCCFHIVVVFVAAVDDDVDDVVAVIVASVLRQAEIATGCRGMKPALTTIFVIRCHNRMIPSMFHVSLGGKTSAIHPRFSFNMFTESTRIPSTRFLGNSSKIYILHLHKTLLISDDNLESLLRPSANSLLLVRVESCCLLGQLTPVNNIQHSTSNIPVNNYCLNVTTFHHVFLPSPDL